MHASDVWAAIAIFAIGMRYQLSESGSLNTRIPWTAITPLAQKHSESKNDIIDPSQPDGLRTSSYGLDPTIELTVHCQL